MRARAHLALAIVLSWSALGHAAGVPVDEASKAQWRAAQKTFLAADELFDAKRYEEALTAYRASWNIVASPNSRLQMARALRELGRYDEAFQQFVGTIEDAERAAKTDRKYAPTVEAAKKEMAAMEQRVARLSIELSTPPPGTRVRVGDARYDAEELPTQLIVTAGQQQVIVEVPGRDPIEKNLTLAGGSSQKLRIDLDTGTAEQAPAVAPARAAPPAPPPVSDRPVESRSSLAPYAYVAGGVGIAGLAAFTAFGLMNQSKFSDLEDSCPDNRCGPDRQEDIDSGKRYQTFANVGLIVGIVGVGVGTTLFVLDSGGDEKTATRLELGPGSLRVEQRF